MRTLTLFRAYQVAEYWCKHYERQRGTNQGIAVHQDNCALIWQRYNRMAHKFEDRLVKRLEANP